ncbi:MAG: XRE family transcriptional regulator [Collinsella sp.]|nr:XRE family transcriptional regulator [Collinsella sp.]
MSFFGDNIARLRAENGLSQRELAAALGISKSTIGAWETKNTLPDWDRLGEVASYFGVRADTLFRQYYPARDEEEFSSSELRVFGRIAAGTPLEMDEGDYGFPCPTYLMKRHPKAFYLRIEGESMNRVLPNGALVLIDPTLREPVINNNVYAVCINGYDATLKRVKQLQNGLELIPDSTDPFYKPTVFDMNDEKTESVTIIGKAVWYTVMFDYEI